MMAVFEMSERLCLFGCLSGRILQNDSRTSDYCVPTTYRT